MKIQEFKQPLSNLKSAVQEVEEALFAVKTKSVNPALYVSSLSESLKEISSKLSALIYVLEISEEEKFIHTEFVK